MSVPSAVEPYLRWELERAYGKPFGVPPLLLEFKAGFKWWKVPFFRDQIVQKAYDDEVRYATAFVKSPKQWLALLAYALAGKVSRIASGAARYAPYAPPPVTFPPLAGAGDTVVAVIDVGFAFAHERFRVRKQNGQWESRVAYLWDQGSSDLTGNKPWKKAQGFAYGRELVGTDIDALLASCRSTLGNVDEDLIYRTVGHSDVAAPLTHGTHVLDLAAGQDPRSSAATKAPPIVLVQLPSVSARDSSGAWLAVNVLDAIRYIHRRVSNQAKLVINLSYGAMAGPHDGGLLLEKAIEELMTLRPKDFAIVVPAGNGFRTRGHASTAVTPGSRCYFDVDVSADDPTESFVEFWHATAASVAIEVIAPDGSSTGLKSSGTTCRLSNTKGELIAAVYRDCPGTGVQQRTVVCLMPTTCINGRVPTVMSGRWRIAFEHSPSLTQPVTIDGWIERDDPVLGTTYPARRQAVFADDQSLTNACFDDAPIDRALTLNSIATGKSTIVVGAAMCTDRPVVCDYSACGGTRAGITKIPDAVSLGDESEVLRGVAAAGTRSGMVWRLSGTSVAAPRVTRWIARLFALNSAPLTVMDIRNQLAVHAKAVSDPCGASTGNGRTGCGFID